MRVLLIEDYEPLRRSVAQLLRDEGYLVDALSEGGIALEMMRSHEYTLILLDLRLPDMDGFEFMNELQKNGSTTSIMIMTARDSVPDRVRGLDAGADDYLIKPFSMEELLARVRVLIRRRYSQHQNVIKVDDLEVDTRKRVARRGGEVIDLTSREFSLLELLALRHGGVVSRQEVWGQLYDANYQASSNVVDVYIAHLRRKVERPGRPKLIHTKRGEGYVLAIPEETGRGRSSAKLARVRNIG